MVTGHVVCSIPDFSFLSDVFWNETKGQTIRTGGNANAIIKRVTRTSLGLQGVRVAGKVLASHKKYCKKLGATTNQMTTP